MNKRYYNLIVFFGLLTNVVCGQNASNVVTRTEKVPDDYRCIVGTAADDLQPFIRSHIMWPDKERISRHKKDVNDKRVQEAVTSSFKWIRKVLRSEWVPENLAAIDVLALKAEVVGSEDTEGQGHDVVRFRYKVQNFVVEVASTVSRLTLVIQKDNSENPPVGLNEEIAKRFVGSAIDQFLQEAHRVKNVSLKNITKGKTGYQGNPERKPGTFNIWWGGVYWWTDGRTVMFSLRKADGGPLVLVREKNWF